MKINDAWLGFLRGLGVAVLIAVLHFIGDATHLAIIGSPVIVAILSSGALALEHYLAEGNTTALFGAVKKV